MISTGQALRLLDGPPLAGRAETLDAHLARLGALPAGRATRDTIPALEASGLLGRGGAGFPVGRKWRALAERPSGPAVVVANGAEGEPASAKDRVLMAHRPHLVLDGAQIAAEAIGADEIVVYVGGEHRAAVAAMHRAIDERRGQPQPPIRLVEAPESYIAGEATAAVHYLNAQDARPTTTPPRMSQRGVRGLPTLVQNVESLAWAALIARYGERWYRSAGRNGAEGTALVTLSGAVARGGVHEIELGTTVGELAEAAGGSRAGSRAVLLGGYFGTWARPDDAWSLPLDAEPMRAHGLTFGCGLVGILPDGICGVAATARIMGYLARESAGQCGPCVYGLGSLGEATARLARGEARDRELDDVERWTAQLPDRGACRHPDGAAQLMASALDVFGDEFARHARTGRCSVTGSGIAAA